MENNQNKQNNGILIVVGLVVAALVIGYLYKNRKNSSESFVDTGMPHLTFSNVQTTYAVPKKLTDSTFDGKIVSVANYQASMSPRLGIPEGLRAGLAYATPATANMAFEAGKPMSAGACVASSGAGMATASRPPSIEGYEETKQYADAVGGSCQNASSQNASMMAAMAQGAAAPGGKMVTASAVVTKGMDGTNLQGEPVNVYTVNNLMYSPPGSRYTRSRGVSDMIRGDLPIAPCNTGWFYSGGDPAVDLNRGALAAMGGFDNDTSKNLAALVQKSTLGASSTFAGSPLDRQQKVALAGYAQSDLSVKTTAGPAYTTPQSMYTSFV